MATRSETGFQPRTTPAERRAFFDLLRRIHILEEGGGGPGPEPGTAPNEVHVGTDPPITPETELWYDPDAPGGGGIVMGYVHNQDVAAATWTIDHNLGWQPNVTVSDSSGDQVEGTVTYVTPNTVRIMFSAEFAGVAYLS